MTGPQRVPQLKSRRLRSAVRSVFLVVVLGVVVLCVAGICVAGTALATAGHRPAAAAAKGNPLTAKTRAGQPYVTPGRGATKGPIGANPSMAHGVQLSILNGLLHGLPIFNGDFADPYALVDGDSLYAYATSTTGSATLGPAPLPVLALTRAT